MTTLTPEGRGRLEALAEFFRSSAHVHGLPEATADADAIKAALATIDALQGEVGRLRGDVLILPSGYDAPEHVGWDLRLIADNTDCAAGFPSANGQLLRRVACAYDGLPEDTSHSKALAIARQALSPAQEGET